MPKKQYNLHLKIKMVIFRKRVTIQLKKWTRIWIIIDSFLHFFPTAWFFPKTCYEWTKWLLYILYITPAAESKERKETEVCLTPDTINLCWITLDSDNVSQINWATASCEREDKSVSWFIFENCTDLPVYLGRSFRNK